MAYGMLCFILLLMAMAYGNNLVYGVCFYLTVMGLGLARSINDNVNNCRIESVLAHEIFAGGPQKIQIQIRNVSNESLRQLELRLARKESPVTVNLQPHETKLVELLWTPPHRGYLQAPAVRLNSPYPSALFNAWKVKRFKDSVIAYPALKGQKNYPEAARASSESIGVLREIRDYKPGDSPRRIHWRSLAKNGQLRTMVHENQEGQSCYFNWDQVQGLKLEEKLSQLALWLHLAHKNGQPWTLKLPQHEFDSGHGTQAYHAALKHLALWQESA